MTNDTCRDRFEARWEITNGGTDEPSAEYWFVEGWKARAEEERMNNEYAKQLDDKHLQGFFASACHQIGIAIGKGIDPSQKDLDDRVLYGCELRDRLNSEALAAVHDKAKVDGREVVEKILNNITDRRGWRQEWYGFDDEVKQEIKDALAVIVAPYLRTTQPDMAALMKVRDALDHLIDMVPTLDDRECNEALQMYKANAKESLVTLDTLIGKAGD